MKKFLAFIAVLVLLVMIGALIFIARFDVDHYRPLIVKQLEAALGTPVQLEHLSLTWRQGLALRADGLRIQDPASLSGEALATVEQTSALVRVGPLLQKRLDIASVVLERPVIRLIKDAQGRLNAAGLAPVALPVSASSKAQASASATPSAPAGQSSSQISAKPPVTLNIERIEIKSGDLRFTDASLSPPMELHLTQIGVTITDLSPGKPSTIQAQAALGADLPNIHVKARVTPPDATQAGRLEGIELDVADIPLENVLPSFPSQAPQLRGRLTASFDGQVADLAPERITQSISGRTKIGLAHGVLMNVNILRSALDQLSMIPGLVEKLQAELPPEYLAKLEARDTPLSPFDTYISLDQGWVQFNDLTAGTDTAELAASGRASFQGLVQARGFLRITPALSEAIFRSVKELKGLANGKGQIEFPVMIEYPSPTVVIPDLQYIGQKVILSTTTEFLGELLRKQLAPESEQAPPAATTSGDQAPSTQGAPTPSASSENSPSESSLEFLLKRALDKALAPDQSNAPQQQ